MKNTKRLKRRLSAKQDLSQFSYSELLTRKRQLDREIVGIKSQLDQARAGVLEGGQDADRGWHTRANHAVRAKGLETQLIQDELARRKLEKHPSNLAAHFMAVAERRLTPEVFGDILNEARELHNSDTQ